MNNYKKYILENKFGWQIDRPVFVKIPFNAYGKTWKAGEEFNWQVQACRAEDYPKMLNTVSLMYKTGKIHHDSNREVQQKVGDRLGELGPQELLSLVRTINTVVKQRCTTEKEFQNKRLKQSKIADKQRGLIRAWLNRNHWAMDEYVKIRDALLDKANSKTPSSEPEGEIEHEEET